MNLEYHDFDIIGSKPDKAYENTPLLAIEN